MNHDIWIVLVVIIGALILFISEWVSIDVVALGISVVLVLSGVISPEQGVEGFANSATITVAFMFVMSAALYKTGALHFAGPYFAKLFTYNYHIGMIVSLSVIAFISAFINNTPLVAVFIPVMLSVANSTKINASQLLIPVSYAAIFGGVCSLIGTSTNIVVSGIAIKSGLPPLSMFQFTDVGIIFAIVGIAYVVVFGKKLLPDRTFEKDLTKKFSIRSYVTQFKINEGSSLHNQRIMDTILARDFEMDILEVKRKEDSFTVPNGDFRLHSEDIIKVKCQFDQLKALKDRLKIDFKNELSVQTGDFQTGDTTLVELVVSPNSSFEGSNLHELDFRRRFRAVPLAIMHREEVLYDDIQEVTLKSGDIILAEIKSHRLNSLKEPDQQGELPFIILSEEIGMYFKKKKFAFVSFIILAVVLLSAFEIVNIMTASIAAAVLLVVSKTITVQEMHESIEWKVIFLLAGALSLGTAMFESGLATVIADFLSINLGNYGPYVVLSLLYLITMILTELMSNNATAALITPIAIATAQSMGVSYEPFILAVMFAASACFSTPIGYQTNTMVYTAGQYRFTDFLKIGIPLNLILWIVASLLIPLFHPF